MSNKKLTRREFLKTVAQAGLTAAITSPLSVFAAEKKKKTKPQPAEKNMGAVVNVTKNAEPGELIRQCITLMGGMEKFVKKGDVVVIKPNIGFDRTPELACTTNPEVVAELIKLAYSAGAKKVVMLDRPCSRAEDSYRNSGIEKAARDAGAEVKFVTKSMYINTAIPGGVALKEWPFVKDILECNAWINVPIAKHHGFTKLSLGIKNYLGIVGGNRGLFHSNMHPWLADLCLVTKPKLVVMDAVRARLRNGPSGGMPEDVEQWDTVAMSTDIVAVDAYTATLFKYKPEEIGYIKEAYDRGLGEMDLAKVNVVIKDFGKK
ncbi:MAG: DUF362 domain-containing protein [Elusimicrobiota bacterium]